MLTHWSQLVPNTSARHPRTLSNTGNTKRVGAAGPAGEAVGSGGVLAADCRLRHGNRPGRLQWQTEGREWGLGRPRHGNQHGLLLRQTEGREWGLGRLRHGNQPDHFLWQTEGRGRVKGRQRCGCGSRSRNPDHERSGHYHRRFDFPLRLPCYRLDWGGGGGRRGKMVPGMGTRKR